MVAWTITSHCFALSCGFICLSLLFLCAACRKYWLWPFSCFLCPTPPSAVLLPLSPPLALLLSSFCTFLFLFLQFFCPFLLICTSFTLLLLHFAPPSILLSVSALVALILLFSCCSFIFLQYFLILLPSFCFWSFSLLLLFPFLMSFSD